MGKYSVLRDFVSETGVGTLPYDLSTVPSEQLTDLIGVSASWVVAVIRWKIVGTFSRDIMASSLNVNNTNVTDILDVMVIDNDVIRISADSAKENFSPSLSMFLAPNRDYTKEILPDDWIFAWFVNSEADAQDLVQRINRREACNFFPDGLKFVGRVNSVRESIGISEDGGLKTLRYTLNASAFKEFNSTIFYNQYLAVNFPSIGEYLAALGTSLNKLIDANGGGIDSNLIIPELIELLLGRGVSSQFSAPGGSTVAAFGGTSTGNDVVNGDPTKEAPYAYVVPAEVAALLGQTQSSRAGGVFSFADVMDAVIGVQRFTGSGIDGNTGPESVFTPDGVVSTTGLGGRRNSTGKKLLGTFLPQSVTFTDNSVWAILNQFLNPAVNEMYACLRVNGSGLVVPTLTVRQFPFTTQLGADSAPNNINVTPYLEVPRWHLHSSLIRNIERGRSSALRFNFIMITGQDIMMQANNSPTEQVIRNPPIRDDMDAKRNGLHPYQVNVACSQQDTFGSSITPWIRIVSDFLINQELTFNGTFVTVGIQAPICPGDNLEFDGVVYHIESVSHQGEIQPNGKKRFSTILTVSHGMVDNPQTTPAIGQTGNNDVAMYSSIRGFATTGGTTTTMGAPSVTVELKSGQSTTPTPISSDTGAALPTDFSVSNPSQGSA